MPVKPCTRCHTPKPLSEFGARTRSKDGVSYICMLCVNEVRRIGYAEEKRQAAKQVRSPQVAPVRPHSYAKPSRVTSARQLILDALTPRELTWDDLQSTTRLSDDAMSETLLTLTSEGLVGSQSRVYWVKRVA